MSGKSWILVAPDWASLDTIWRSPLPFVLWPVCDKTLLDHWLDEAVRQGVESVTIEAVDRPHLLRRWLDQRDLWSRAIAIRSQRMEEPGAKRVVMDHLPGDAAPDRPHTAEGLLWRWYDLQGQALKGRKADHVHLDHELEPGVWAGPGARIDPSAKFTAPCRVGSYARVGPGCRLGPHAYVGEGAYLDEDVEVVEAIICANTYAGAHTSFFHMAAQGGLLLNLDKGVAVEVVDSFIMGTVGRDAAVPGAGERLLAILLGPLLEFLALLASGGRRSRRWVQLGRFREVELTDYEAGPLCLRRAAWWRAIARGEMRFAGVLPRSQEDWDRLPAEARAVLEGAPAGMFALSDLYQCHSPAYADEWTHALFQAGAADGIGQKLSRRNLLHIALTKPVTP